MTDHNLVLIDQLKQACKQTGAKWGVWLTRQEKDWNMPADFALNKVRQLALANFLSQPKTAAWLAGAFSSGRMRSRQAADFPDLNCDRIYAFANPQRQTALLVGAGELSKEAQGLFRILSLDAPQDSQPEQALPHAEDSAAAFSNFARYTQQFSLLTELAAAASSGADTDEVCDRVSHRLRRTFGTDLVAVMLLSSDGKTLREYGIQRRTAPIRLPVHSSLAGYAVETGLPVRVGDIQQAPRYPKRQQTVNSALIVPLKYRKQVIGVLSVESEEPKAFTAQDEQLLVVIASHLAGLLENMRLYGEAVERASNLNLIHKVVQRIVGLTDMGEIAQATAEMMAEYFGYEFVLVMLADEKKKNLIQQGIGGTQAHLIERGTAFPVELGITGHVFQMGESYFTNNTGQDPYYFSPVEWTSGSELCVPLREGDQIIGVLNLERTIKNAFNEQDLLLVDSLAGILSSVLMNACRHQELRTTVSQLNAARSTALEITADLDARILYQRLIQRASTLVDARGAALGLVDHEAQTVRIVVHETPWYPPLGSDEEYQVPFHRGVVGEVAATGQPLRVDSYPSWEKHLTIDAENWFVAAAGVPLIWRGEVLGVLMVMDDRPERVFQDSDIQILQLLAPQAAVSIRNATLYNELIRSLEAQRRVENQLLLSARLAALGEMAAGVAHELNNPLTTIAGFVELALDELPADLPQHEELTLVMGEALRARRVVRGLLDFAHQSSNLRQPADLNALLNEVLTLVQLQAQNSNIQIQLERRGDLPQIQVDVNQIKQVVINLIQNAFQSMPQGGSLILTTGQQAHEGQAGVFLTVQDSGEGISPENLGRIFDPFYTTRPVGKGTGLGLSMSYGLVTGHGGVLSVESQVGSGACFRVWLPLEMEASSA